MYPNTAETGASAELTELDNSQPEFFAARPDIVSKAREIANRTTEIESLLNDPESIGPDTVSSVVSTIGIAVSTRCNIRCAGCYASRTFEDEGDFTINTDRLNSILDEAPNASVSIGGGEPFLFPEHTVGLAKSLLEKGRRVSFATNGLLLTDKEKSSEIKQLLGELPEVYREKITVGISIDLMHQRGSRLDESSYLSRIDAAIDYLQKLGFKVSTNSVFLFDQDPAFFREKIEPLLSGRCIESSVSPNMFNPSEESLSEISSLIKEERVSSPSLEYVDTVRNREVNRPSTAPWCIVEVRLGRDPSDTEGNMPLIPSVLGPSPYADSSEQKGHRTILGMLQSYDWEKVASEMPMETTIVQGALYYSFSPEGKVTLNKKYLTKKLIRKMSQVLRQRLT